MRVVPTVIFLFSIFGDARAINANVSDLLVQCSFVSHYLKCNKSQEFYFYGLVFMWAVFIQTTGAEANKGKGFLSHLICIIRRIYVRKLKRFVLK
jgi:hypothetical protein